MKKVVLLMVLAMVFMVGCQGQSQPADDSAAQEPAQQEQPVEEDTSQQDQNTNAEEEQVPQQDQNTQNSQNSKTISENKAKSIALSDAGLSSSAVEYIIANLEMDDGRLEYEVDFYTSNTEYGYTLDAVSGKILEKDQEAREMYDD